MAERPPIGKHVRAALLLPVMVTLVIPGAILLVTGDGTVRSPFGLTLRLIVILAGLLLIGAGLVLVVWTVALFARVGRGTLAPWDATKKLIVVGPYCHVRNPMISGVFFILLGEALLFCSWPLAVWFVLFVLANATYIPLSEEPGLARRFGEPYVRYKRHVPRWIPRLRPWNEAADETDPNVGPQ